MPTNRESVLYVRCSDGRTKRPDEILGHCVHQIRLPGGVLNPEYCARRFGQDAAQGILRESLLYQIETMVQLKAPKEIIVAAHSDCGAAQAIGLSDADVDAMHLEWGALIEERFPNLRVRVYREEHSACGEHHHGHIDLRVAA